MLHGLNFLYIHRRRTWCDNNAMHAKPDLRVLFEPVVTFSGSVILDAIPLELTLEADYAARHLDQKTRIK